MFTDALNRNLSHADYDGHPELRRAQDGGIDYNYYRTLGHRERAKAVASAASGLGRLIRRVF
jgi:hypothetical protein